MDPCRTAIGAQTAAGQSGCQATTGTALNRRRLPKRGIAVATGRERDSRVSDGFSPAAASQAIRYDKWNLATSAEPTADARNDSTSSNHRIRQARTGWQPAHGSPGHAT
jgi:hypothetical protein